MTGGYFSERTRGPRPRTEAESSREFWGGIIATIRSGLRNGLFAELFPEHCEDGPFVISTDIRAFQLDFSGDFPEIEWPLDIDQPIPTYRQLDVVEYIYRSSSTPERLHYHDFPGHYHLDFNDRDNDRPLRDRVNRLFVASRMAYELRADGLVQYLGSPLAGEFLHHGLTSSKDPTFDRKLDEAHREFLEHDAAQRRLALEPLWDAFERMKTILDADKKTGARLLIAASTTNTAEASLIEAEMRTLTEIGNQFQIRHHETDKAPVGDALAEYLFMRLYTLMYRLHPGIAR